MFKIAIVDNNLRHSELLKFWLEDAGYCVATFADLARALGNIRDGETFDLMIIETSTTMRDSLSVYRDEIGVPFIIRGCERISDSAPQSRTGCTGEKYVSKPLDLYEVLTMVANCLYATDLLGFPMPRSRIRHSNQSRFKFCSHP